MNFNNKLAAAGILTLLATAITALALSTEPPEIQPPTDDNEIASVSTVSLDDQIYILRNLDGFVCVYTADDMETPKIRTEIDVSRLRVYDAELLDDGIAVTGNDALLRILEDFGP